MSKDEYSLMNSKLYIGIHGYLIVYSVASRQSFDMVRIIRDKLLNHLVCISASFLPQTTEHNPGSGFCTNHDCRKQK